MPENPNNQLIIGLALGEVFCLGLLLDWVRVRIWAKFRVRVSIMVKLSVRIKAVAGLGLKLGLGLRFVLGQCLVWTLGLWLRLKFR